jgi:hypothetical protein
LQQTPPPEVKYAADISILPVNKRVDVVRVACRDRLPEVEFNQRHGTTSNAYLLKVHAATSCRCTAHVGHMPLALCTCHCLRGSGNLGLLAGDALQLHLLLETWLMTSPCIPY